LDRRVVLFFLKIERFAAVDRGEAGAVRAPCPLIQRIQALADQVTLDSVPGATKARLSLLPLGPQKA
jgi:hypothetical protein